MLYPAGKAFSWPARSMPVVAGLRLGLGLRFGDSLVENSPNPPRLADWGVMETRLEQVGQAPSSREAGWGRVLHSVSMARTPSGSLQPA